MISDIMTVQHFNDGSLTLLCNIHRHRKKYNETAKSNETASNYS